LLPKSKKSLEFKITSPPTPHLKERGVKFAPLHLSGCKKTQTLSIVCIFLFFLIPAFLFSQIKLKTYTTATDTFYWKKYEQVRKPKKLNLKPYMISGTGTIVDLFLSKNLQDFPQFTNDSISRYTIKDLKKCLYPVDLNGDGQVDMIFTGFSGGESDVTRIYLNLGNSFKLMFEDYQFIVSLTITNGKLTRLKTADPGCCDAYLYFERDYEVRQETGSLNFIRGKQTVEYSRTERPVNLLKTPVPWQSLHDTILIRASAAILDEPFNPHLETLGNIIAGYKQKIRGTILAVQKGRDGMEWFYIEIIPDVKPAKSIFYEIEKYPTFIRGWVESFDVKANLTK